MPTQAVSDEITQVLDTRLIKDTFQVVNQYPKIALSVPYQVAVKSRLADHTPVVSVATTPVLETRLLIETFTVVSPYPKIALSVQYEAAAKYCLAVPTPVVSVATTQVLDTRLVIETKEPFSPYPKIAFLEAVTGGAEDEGRLIPYLILITDIMILVMLSVLCTCYFLQ